MSDTSRDVDHAAVDELLPWFVNGTLDPGELARVRRHLEACEACRESVSLLSRVSAAISRPATTPILPPARPEALLERIDRSGHAVSRRWNRPALAATAAIAIVVSALLLWPGQEAGLPEPPAYETATSVPQPATMDYVMSIVFEPGVGPEDRQRVLRDLEAGNVRPGESGGAYEVNVTLAASSLTELARFAAAVEARPEVESARIVALQLPVQRETGRDDR